MGWISPTGANDPGSEWTEEAFAYDEDVGTRALRLNIGPGDSTSWLELTHAAIDCSKVQYYIGTTHQRVKTVYVEVFWSGAWHEIYTGVFVENSWIEKELGGTYSVTGVRFKFYGDQAEYFDHAYVWEVDFWEVEIVAPTVTTQAVSSIGTTTATGNGNITATGGEDCDKRGFAYDYITHGDPGDTAPGASDYAKYVEDSNSFGTGAFTKTLIDLWRGAKIFVRAYAHNSAGYAYGDEVNFFTPSGDGIALFQEPAIV